MRELFARQFCAEKVTGWEQMCINGAIRLFICGEVCKIEASVARGGWEEWFKKQPDEGAPCAGNQILLSLRKQEQLCWKGGGK